MAEFVANYGIWVVAAFIALESVGIPLPAEAALIAAGFFAARTHGIHIWTLIGAGIIAAIMGEIVGFWIGRRYGHQLSARHGARLGLTPGRIRIGQWLFARYGGRFVFIARFLPILRNMAAVLAGTNAMAQHSFYSPAPRRPRPGSCATGSRPIPSAKRSEPGFAGGGDPRPCGSSDRPDGAAVHRALREAPAGESRRGAQRIPAERVGSRGAAIPRRWIRRLMRLM